MTLVPSCYIKKGSEHMAIYPVKATKRKRVTKDPPSPAGPVSFRDRKSAGWVLKRVRLDVKPRAQSVFVVGLLLARGGDAVLRLAGARTQAVQSAAVLGVVDVVLEKKLSKTKIINSARLTREAVRTL